MIRARAAALALGLGVAGRAAVAATPPEQPAVDLSRATIVVPAGAEGPARRAADLLAEEIALRTGLRLPVATAWPPAPRAVIAVGTAADVKTFAGRFAPALAAETPRAAPEGYRVRVERDGARPVVLVVGNDPRGAVFGAGRLLRAMAWSAGALAVPEALDVFTAPKLALRGHQIATGPRATCGAGWGAAEWERAVRDLALFGANAVELVAPPGAAADPAAIERLQLLARAAEGYGLAVSLALPSIDEPGAWPEPQAGPGPAFGALYEKLPKLAGLTIVGGAGRRDPKALLAAAEREAAGLRRLHPQAEVWIAPPRFDPAATAFAKLAKEGIPWATGVLYEPEPRLPLLRFRARVGRNATMRHHPDVTQSQGGRIPLAGWDPALARTAGTHPVNPRPQLMAELARSVRYSNGFVTRSDGCHDDVNKAIWSAVGWDSGADVAEILRQWARVFVGPWAEAGLAQAVRGLERSWQAPLAANPEVEILLAQLEALAAAAPPRGAETWRFQQLLYRAQSDALVRLRLLHEEAAAAEARARLRAGGAGAVDEALAALERAAPGPAVAAARARLAAVARRLERSAGMRLGAEALAQAHPAAGELGGGEGGAAREAPVGDRLFLQRRLAAIRALPTEAARARMLAELTAGRTPGPGALYDDLGGPGGALRLVGRAPLDGEPGTLAPVPGLVAPTPADVPVPEAHATCAPAADGETLELRYRGLDPRARYRVRAVYVGEPGTRVRLRADGAIVHPFSDRKLAPVEADLPPARTADGDVTLTFTHEATTPGADPTCQVAEVWLVPR